MPPAVPVLAHLSQLADRTVAEAVTAARPALAAQPTEDEL